MESLKIAILSSVLNRGGDEGVKNFASKIGREWQKQNHNLLWINLGGKSTKDGMASIDPWLRLWKIPHKLKKFFPDLVVYYPDASLNILSALRSRYFHAIFPSAKLLLIALQSEPHVNRQAWVIRIVKGFDKLYVQSQHTAEDYKGIEELISVIPSGVDKLRFHPVSTSKKRELRLKFKVKSDRPSVLHVGHFRTTRNLEKLLPIQQDGFAQLILVGSTSTPQDQSLVQRCKEAGAMVIDYYLEQIEELYQMADLYIFPVVSPGAAIEFPLSVLEALACGLPVVSTPFGGLPDFLSDKDGIYFTSQDKLVEEARNVINHPNSVSTLSSIFEWETIARGMLVDVGLLI